MAEETKNPDPAATAATTDAPADDTIDLAGLVNNIDMTPTDGSGKPGATPTPVPAAHEPIHAEELSPEKIDEILLEEDPSLAAQMEAIREAGFSSDAEEIKTLEQEDAAVGQALRGQAKLTSGSRFRLWLLKVGTLVRAMRRFAFRALKDSKGVLRELAARSKVLLTNFLKRRKAELGSGIGWLNSRSLLQKLSLLSVIAILVGFGFVALKTLRGSLLPKTERVWVASFADRADGVFTYPEDATFEDFNDPLLHPEFVIIVERIVVNLTRTPNAPESANPMAAFELYVQTDNQEAAVEIKDRNVEIRDAVARSIERMTYPDLAGEEGKAKLKLLLRKDLNEIITKGKVRRVFFKTIVLNPE